MSFSPCNRKSPVGIPFRVTALYHLRSQHKHVTNPSFVIHVFLLSAT